MQEDAQFLRGIGAGGRHGNLLLQFGRGPGVIGQDILGFLAGERAESDEQKTAKSEADCELAHGGSAIQ